MSKSTNDNKPQENNASETGNRDATLIATQITFENAIIGLAGLIKDLNIPCGISEIILPPLTETIIAASVANPDPQTIREPLERYTQYVEEYQETINSLENPFIGFDNTASFLRYSGATLTGCLPQALRVPIPANAVMLALTAAQKNCIIKCLGKFALCTGLSGAAVVACGLGCLPLLLFGPPAFVGCVGVCSGVATGTLEVICMSRLANCVIDCVY